jgi:hypothetical protein
MAHHAAFHECHLLPGVPQERQVYRTSPSGEDDMRATLVSNSFLIVLCEGALILRLDEENLVYLGSPKRTGNLTFNVQISWSRYAGADESATCRQFGLNHRRQRSLVSALVRKCRATVGADVDMKGSGGRVRTTIWRVLHDSYM